MTEKIRLGVLCGGRSSEHEVSVKSARSMLEAIDYERYDVTVVGITRDGQWLTGADPERLLNHGTIDSSAMTDVAEVTVRGDRLVPVSRSNGIGPSASNEASFGIDVIFPLLHGPYGEDGTVQGLLELADIPYVGAGVLGSAVSMDKDVANRLFQAAGLNQVDYQTIRSQQWCQDREHTLAGLLQRFEFPLFVKPANAGSSVGVSKVQNRDELIHGIETARQFDEKTIIENDAGDCHEVECAVLGNDSPEASVVGEILPGNDFYDYADKYINGQSRLIIPAPLTETVTHAVQQAAITAFKAVEAEGLARVDFFVRRTDHAIIINEINTMPGFTPISMYPKLWAASGLSYPCLIDRLVDLAIARHRQRKNLKLTP